MEMEDDSVEEMLRDIRDFQEIDMESEGDEDAYLDILISNEIFQSRRLKIYENLKNPLEDMDDSKFESIYRFKKNTAKMIIDLVREDLQRPNPQGAPIPPELMVLATIKYMASGDSQASIAQQLGFSQGTMSYVVKEVVRAIASRMRQFIKFPLDRRSLNDLKAGFYSIAQFPQCIGAIDCTHIKIKNPGGELGGRHRCRKGFYSLNVQVICDHECRIMDIVSRWRGSVHDSHIWRNSAIKRKLEAANLYGGVLLGDGGYPESRILLTPFRISSTLSEAEQRYNRAHIATRIRVEQLFGQLKNKFRICFSGIQVELNSAKNMIVAMAVLFNISKMNNDNVGLETEMIRPSNNNTDDYNREQQGQESAQRATHRQRFIARYFAE